MTKDLELASNGCWPFQITTQISDCVVKPRALSRHYGNTVFGGNTDLMAFGFFWNVQLRMVALVVRKLKVAAVADQFLLHNRILTNKGGADRRNWKLHYSR